MKKFAGPVPYVFVSCAIIFGGVECSAQYSHRSINHSNPTHDAHSTHASHPHKTVTYFLAGVDYGQYLANVHKRVLGQWHLPKNVHRAAATIRFSVAKDGSVSNLRMIHSSGVAAFDEAVRNAVNHSSPLMQLPAKSTGVDIEIEFNDLPRGIDHMTVVAP
jgi:TonB family protein